MNYYAFRRKKDGRLVSGTDFRYYPHHQILATEDRPPRIFSKLEVKSEILRRGINLKHYEIVEVKIEVSG